VLSGRNLCDEMITRPERTYRMCSVVACSLETSRMNNPGPLRTISPQSDTNVRLNPLFSFVLMEVLNDSRVSGDNLENVTYY